MFTYLLLCFLLCLGCWLYLGFLILQQHQQQQKKKMMSRQTKLKVVSQGTKHGEGPLQTKHGGMSLVCGECIYHDNIIIITPSAGTCTCIYLHE